MALIDKASLLMVPSTYEAGKLYNVLPSGNRAPDSTDQNNGYDQTRADFDFDRGSNAAATRVNAAGLIEKYRENLFTESNKFSDSDWTPKAGTFAQGVTDPNSGTDAWSWKAVNTDPFLYQAKNFTGVHCLSIYVKGVGSTIGEDFQIRVGGNLKDVVLTGDWQRVQHFGVLSGNTNIGFEYGNPATLNDVVHIYAAQLETGLVATDYLNSGATTAKSGVLVDLPRINYDANGKNGALLLEPQRANLIQYSEYLNGIYWNGKIGVSFGTNQTASPEGLDNSSLLKEDSSNGSHFAYKDLSLTSGTTYAISIYAKKNGTNRNLRFSDGGLGWSSGFTASFDLTAGTATGGDIESVGNGWYRCSVTGTTNATTSRLIVYSTLNTATSYQGDGTSGVFLYGFQIEAASYSSSYIPNHGTSGGVTRAADSCLSSSITTSTDFSIIFEAKDFCLINGSVGGSYDHIQFVFSPTGGPYGSGGSYHIYANQLYYFNGSTNTSFGVIFNSQTDSKFALVKRGNKGIIYANGVKKTEITLPSGADAKVINWDTIDLTQSLQDAQGDVFGSNYKQLIKFNEALSDSELATLTTL